MPTINIKKKKRGRELAERIYLGVRTGMRRDVAEYRALMAANKPLEAESRIERAIDLPRRARIRINEAITRYGLPALAEALALYGDVTITELDAELAADEVYAQSLFDRKNGGESWDSLAADIEASIPLESEEWTFPLPSGYKDIWGK